MGWRPWSERQQVTDLQLTVLVQLEQHRPHEAGDRRDIGQDAAAAAITRMVGSQLLEQQEEWQLERRRFSEATLAKIHEPQESCALTDDAPEVDPGT